MFHGTTPLFKGVVNVSTWVIHLQTLNTITTLCIWDSGNDRLFSNFKAAWLLYNYPLSTCLWKERIPISIHAVLGFPLESNFCPPYELKAKWNPTFVLLMKGRPIKRRGHPLKMRRRDTYRNWKAKKYCIYAYKTIISGFFLKWDRFIFVTYFYGFKYYNFCYALLLM